MGTKVYQIGFSFDTYMDVVNVFTNLDRNCLSRVPPRQKKIEVDDVYVYELRNGDEVKFYRNDGLSWTQVRSRIFPKVGRGIIRKCEFQLVNESGQLVSYFKDEYTDEDVRDQRIIIDVSKMKYPFVLAHYYGTYDIKSLLERRSNVPVSKPSTSRASVPVPIKIMDEPIRRSGRTPKPVKKASYFEDGDDDDNDAMDSKYSSRLPPKKSVRFDPDPNFVVESYNGVSKRSASQPSPSPSPRGRGRPPGRGRQSKTPTPYSSPTPSTSYSSRGRGNSALGRSPGVRFTGVTEVIDVDDDDDPLMHVETVVAAPDTFVCPAGSFSFGNSDATDISNIVVSKTESLAPTPTPNSRPGPLSKKPGYTAKPRRFQDTIPSATFSSLSSLYSVSTSYQDRNDLENETHTKLHDDIYMVYALAQESPGIVQYFQLAKSVAIVIAADHVLKHTCSLYKEIDSVVYFYDAATFRKREFGICTLSLRHPMVQSNKDNRHVIPVATLIYKPDFAVNPHEIMFNVMKKSIKELDSEDSIIVASNEDDVRSALRKEFAFAHVFTCWSDLKKGAKDWAEKHIKDPLSVAKYEFDVFNLLTSLTSDEYREKLSTLKSEWKEEFTSFFQQNLEDAVSGSTQLQLDQSGVEFKDESTLCAGGGVINLMPQAFVQPFEKIFHHKDCNYLRMSYGAYLIQCSSMVSVVRDLQQHRGDNPGTCQSVFLPEESALPDVLNENDIPNVINKGDMPDNLKKHTGKLLPSSTGRKTQEGLAKMYIAQNRIDFLPLRGEMLVEGFNKKKYVVNIGSEKCSCSQKNDAMCSHLIACLLATNLYYNRKKTIPAFRKVGSLRELLWRRRNTRKVPRNQMVRKLQKIKKSKAVNGIAKIKAEDVKPTVSAIAKKSTSRPAGLVWNPIINNY